MSLFDEVSANSRESIRDRWLKYKANEIIKQITLEIKEASMRGERNIAYSPGRKVWVSDGPNEWVRFGNDESYLYYWDHDERYHSINDVYLTANDTQRDSYVLQNERILCYIPSEDMPELKHLVCRYFNREGFSHVVVQFVAETRIIKTGGHRFLNIWIGEKEKVINNKYLKVAIHW